MYSFSNHFIESKHISVIFYIDQPQPSATTTIIIFDTQITTDYSIFTEGGNQLVQSCVENLQAISPMFAQFVTQLHCISNSDASCAIVIQFLLHFKFHARFNRFCGSLKQMRINKRWKIYSCAFKFQLMLLIFGNASTIFALKTGKIQLTT